MLLGFKHNISCSFRYHNPKQSADWNQKVYGSNHFPRGVGVNLSFWSWWTAEGAEGSVQLKNKLDHRWLFEEKPTTPENLLISLHKEAGEHCAGLCLIENEEWAVCTDRKDFFLVYREKDFSKQKEFYFMKQIDEQTGLIMGREEARQKASDYVEKNIEFDPPLVGYKQQAYVRTGFIGHTAEAVQHGVLFAFPIVWP